MSFPFSHKSASSLILIALSIIAPLTCNNAKAQEDYTISDEAVEDIDGEESKTSSTRNKGEVPDMFKDDSQLDESYIDQELGVNVYTAPAIDKIFAQLEGLPSIPDEYVLRTRPDLLPTNSGALALEMGFLLADGFIAVRSGRMNDIKPIALDLSRYGKAMGVGERMNMHSASLLEQAEKGLLDKFKETLSATQSDVNAELRALKDPDQPHLIALGGWVRALTASAAAINAHFDAQQAAIIFYPDAPDYFREIIDGINPQSSKNLPIKEIKKELEHLSHLMNLKEGEAASPEKVQAILNCSQLLSNYCTGM